jgi:hypothetical protein
MKVQETCPEKGMGLHHNSRRFEGLRHAERESIYRKGENPDPQNSKIITN